MLPLSPDGGVLLGEASILGVGRVDGKTAAAPRDGAGGGNWAFIRQVPASQEPGLSMSGSESMGVDAHQHPSGSFLVDS